MPQVDIKPHPTMINERASATPERTYAIIPKSESLQDGFRNFTYKQLARAVDKMSWWLDDNLGKSTNLDTIAYMGPSDLRYTFLYIAALKTHRKVLLPLFMNSKQAHLSLLNSTNCTTLIASTELLHHWHALSPEIDDFKILTMPPFEDFIDDCEVRPYLFTKSWDDMKNDPIYIAQTSGTTGLPKPIIYTSYMISILTWGKAELLFRSIKFIVPMPPSWIAGFYSYAPLPFRCDAIPILLPVTAPQPMTPEYIDQVHTSVNAEAGIYIPAVLKELARKPEYVDHMRHMKWVGFVGAPLDQETGNVFTSFLRVQPLMGSTEVGGYGLLLSEQDEWMYYNFGIAPETGFRFLPYQDDLYESVVVRHTDPIKFGTQVIFHVFPDLDVYHTKDVWREHPTKKGLWLMCGRTDDFVKLANLTKFNATHIEATLLTNPMVQAIVVGGEGRKTPFLLIELADEEMDENEALGALWPLIEERNKEVSWEIRLKREMVMFAKKGKPLKKVGAKGTTNRRATIEGYAKEIEELYGRNAALMNGGAS